MFCLSSTLYIDKEDKITIEDHGGDRRFSGDKRRTLTDHRARSKSSGKELQKDDRLIGTDVFHPGVLVGPSRRDLSKGSEFLASGGVDRQMNDYRKLHHVLSVVENSGK